MYKMGDKKLSLILAEPDSELRSLFDLVARTSWAPDLGISPPNLRVDTVRDNTELGFYFREQFFLEEPYDFVFMDLDRTSLLNGDAFIKYIRGVKDERVSQTPICIIAEVNRVDEEEARRYATQYGNVYIARIPLAFSPNSPIKDLLRGYLFNGNHLTSSALSVQQLQTPPSARETPGGDRPQSFRP